MRVNALQLCGFNTKRCLLGHTEPSWSRSKDSECISAAHRAVLPLVALQEKLAEVMLHPGGHQGIKGWLGQRASRTPSKVGRLLCAWWKCHFYSCTLLAPSTHNCPLRSGWCHINSRTSWPTRAGAPGPASWPLFSYIILIIPVSVIFPVHLSNINIHKKYVKPFWKLNKKHNYSRSYFRSSLLQMKKKLLWSLWFGFTFWSSLNDSKMPSDNGSMVLLCQRQSHST